MSKLPPPLKKGDTISVFAPSSYVEKADIERATALMKKRGYKVFIHPQTFARDNQSAGTHKQKAKAFHDLISCPDTKVIWAAGGGNRTLHLLEHINFARLKKNPKALVGFSDVTALLNAAYAKCDIVTFHGPVFKNLPQYKEMDELLALLSGKNVTSKLKGAKVLRHGTAQGHFIGGNLSLFQYLPQTLPKKFWKNGILFLEDCNEELSRVDRVFAHLKRIGVLDEINALVLGEFSGMVDSGRPFGFSFEDIINEHLANRRIPIISGAAFGHGKNLFPIAIGAHGKLSTKPMEMRIVLNAIK